MSNTWELLDKLLAKLSVASSRPLDQHSAPQIGGDEDGGDEQFEKGLLRSLRVGEGSAAHPFFGRFRRDNYEEVVKALMVRGCVYYDLFVPLYAIISQSHVNPTFSRAIPDRIPS